MSFLRKLSFLVLFFILFDSLYADYNVTGANLDEIAGQFTSPYPAEATWEITPSITTKTDPLPRQTTGDCLYVAKSTVTEASATLSTSTSYPVWTNKTSACSRMQDEFNRFDAAGHIHEGGHITIANDFQTNSVPTYMTQIKALTGNGTGDTQQKANDAASADLNAQTKAKGEEVMKALQDRQDKYDADTRHGATQDALLNLNITCSTPAASPTPSPTPWQLPSPTPSPAP